MGLGAQCGRSQCSLARRHILQQRTGRERQGKDGVSIVIWFSVNGLQYSAEEDTDRD